MSLHIKSYVLVIKYIVLGDHSSVLKCFNCLDIADSERCTDIATCERGSEVSRLVLTLADQQSYK